MEVLFPIIGAALGYGMLRCLEQLAAWRTLPVASISFLSSPCCRFVLLRHKAGRPTPRVCAQWLLKEAFKFLSCSPRLLVCSPCRSYTGCLFLPPTCACESVSSLVIYTVIVQGRLSDSINDYCGDKIIFCCGGCPVSSRVL